MADEKGIHCLLKVGDQASGASTFTALEGQIDTTFDGSTNVADTTDKGHEGWQTGVATTRSGTVTCTGNLKTSRTQLDLLEAAWAGGTTHECQIVFDEAGNGYEGAFYVTALNISGSVNDVVKYSLTLTPAAALSAISS